MARSKHSTEQKLSALRMLDSVMYTIREVCETHGVSKNTLKRRKKRLETDGIESLNESSS